MRLVALCLLLTACAHKSPYECPELIGRIDQTVFDEEISDRNKVDTIQEWLSHRKIMLMLEGR